MSDTPRTDAAELEANIGVTHFDHKDLSTAYHFARQLERELNEANDRIKRLEAAGDGLLTAMRDDWLEYVDWIDETTDAIGKWNKAKEAKP